MTVAPHVLIAPAMAIGSHFYGPLERAFVTRGWTAETVPRRGFERDGVRAGRDVDWSYADEVATLAAAVAHAGTQRPDRPLLILGHSFGGQLALAVGQGAPRADGLILVGANLPHHRDYTAFGPHLALLAAVVVPVATAVRGFAPPPLFGAPGARTMMREWARMVLTGRPPFTVTRRVTEPALVVDLTGDRLAPRRSVQRFARDYLGPVTTWPYAAPHIAWARDPGPVVDRAVAWWATAGRPAAA